MNKSELITCLRNPHELSDEQLSKLEKVVDANPYFLSARLLLAKASKEKGHPKTKRRVASAAIYSTDRVLLKKYLSGDLFFLSQPPKIREKKVFRTKKKTSETPPTSVKESTTQDKTRVDLPKKERVATRQKTATSGTRLTKATPDVPKGGLDAILEELQRDMENLKNSRAKFVEVQKNIKTESEKDGVVDPTNESQGDTFSKSEENSAEQTATEEQDSVSLDKADSQVTKKSTVPEETDSKSKDKSIAQEALRAIAKAKQEVAEEDEAEKEKQLISEPLAEGPSDPFELDETIDDKPSEDQEIEVRSIEKESSELQNKDDSQATTEKDTKEPKRASERENRSAREPRFSRSSSRSYLSTDQDIDPTAFLDDDYTSPSQSVDKKDEEKTSTLGVEKASTNAKAAESEGTEEQADTPSIKKAKSVARRRIRKATKKADSIEGVDDSTKDVQSDSGGQAAKEDNTDSKKAVKKKVKSDTGGKADKQAADQIIDKFINESPSIKYQRSTESKSQDLSEESGSWDPNLASEYLAEIYLNQGNKKRAIEIYEALSLKYPEKKSYFADLISKID